MSMTIAEEMLSKIEQALRDTPAGTVEVLVDGQKVKYSRSEALKEYAFWKKAVARESGRRPFSGSVNLGRAW